MTRPKRGGGYGGSPPHHAGNLSLHPLTGKTRRIIRNPPAHCKQHDSKNEMKLGDWWIGGLGDLIYLPQRAQRVIWGLRRTESIRGTVR